VKSTKSRCAGDLLSNAAALERLDAERIWRPLEANVRIVELRESEAGGRFVVGPCEITVHFAGFDPPLEERREFIECADPDRGPCDSKKRPSVYSVSHLLSPCPASPAPAAVSQTDADGRICRRFASMRSAVFFASLGRKSQTAFKRPYRRARQIFPPSIAFPARE
jgi:hypothetical protein